MKISFSYTGIRVKDLRESINFYTKVLSMKIVGRSKIAAARGEVANLVSEDEGFSLELNYYAKSSRFNSRYIVGEGLDHLAFKVDDLESFLEQARRMGHPPVVDMKTDTSRWVYIKDPNGIWIELFQG